MIAPSPDLHLVEALEGISITKHVRGTTKTILLAGWAGLTFLVVAIITETVYILSALSPIVTLFEALEGLSITKHVRRTPSTVFVTGCSHTVGSPSKMLNDDKGNGATENLHGLVLEGEVFIQIKDR